LSRPLSARPPPGAAAAGLTSTRVLAAVSPSPGGTVEVAGIPFAPTQSVAGQNLVLNGAGVRYKAIFKVYAAGLYLPQRTTDADQAGTAPGAKRMHVVMLREIDSRELGRFLTDGMEQNATMAEFARCIPGTLQLGDLFARRKVLKEGESFSIDYLPNKGTVVLVNGEPDTAPITEPTFFPIMLRLWLGRKPADNALKRALLGLPAEVNAPKL